MNVICIEEKAFDELITKVYRQVKDLYNKDHLDDWISGVEAMRMLGLNEQLYSYLGIKVLFVSANHRKR